MVSNAKAPSTSWPAVAPWFSWMGEMIGGEVFVFEMNHSGYITPPNVSKIFYLSGTCEEIVDSWGPGYFITNVDTPYGETLYGLGIRGRIIKPNTRFVNGEPLFHWGPDSDGATSQSKTFSYWDKILIRTTTCDAILPPLTAELNQPIPITTHAPFPPATANNHPITANMSCPLVTAKSRKESEPYLSTLGTAPDWWSLTEIQGLASLSPPYCTLQGAFAMTKQSGIPLKRALLDRWIRDDSLSLFEEPWGLQVSLCTGVTRKVPLRALVEEPLFRYIDSLKVDGWEKLKMKATSAISGHHSFFEWSQSLKKDEMQCMRHIFTKLLYLLKDTGFDRSRKQFSILWPHDSDARFCVKICPEKEQLWCSMLQDNEWCAAFTVATSLCLETGKHKCRGKLRRSGGGGIAFNCCMPELRRCKTISYFHETFYCWLAASSQKGVLDRKSWWRYLGSGPQAGGLGYGAQTRAESIPGILLSLAGSSIKGETRCRFPRRGSICFIVEVDLVRQSFQSSSKLALQLPYHQLPRLSCLPHLPC